MGPANPDGERTYQYWPFSHLGRWSAAVAGALHHGRPGANPGRGAETGPGGTTAQPHLVDKGFPLLRPNCELDFERVEGRERLQVYRQTLMAGLRAAARKPTNLAKVNLVRQKPSESPSAFLERLMKAFRKYTPIDPQAEESRAAVLLAFVNQAAPDIRKKLQKIEGLGEQTI